MTQKGLRLGHGGEHLPSVIVNKRPMLLAGRGRITLGVTTLLARVIYSAVSNQAQRPNFLLAIPAGGRPGFVPLMSDVWHTTVFLRMAGLFGVCFGFLREIIPFPRKKIIFQILKGIAWSPPPPGLILTACHSSSWGFKFVICARISNFCLRNRQLGGLGQVLFVPQ